MYQLTASPDILIRLYDGTSCARGTWLWPQDWLDAGNVPEPIPVPVVTAQERIDKAWIAANALCLAGADENSRTRYLMWMMNGTDVQRSRIAAITAWMDSIWMAYAAYRANPVGEFIPPADPCPYTFWEVAQP